MTVQQSRILFPIDFSNRCVSATRHVKTWVDRFGAILDAVHVVDAEVKCAVDGLWRLQAERLEIACIDVDILEPGGFQIGIKDRLRLLARRQDRICGAAGIRDQIPSRGLLDRHNGQL